MIKRENIRIRDPYILRDDKERKYYLYGTTDENAWSGKAVGFNAYYSEDLENWTGPYAVFRPENSFWADENFWAPEVHYYRGRYYMFASFKAEKSCRATQILVADLPLGPFVPLSDNPVTPQDWECLDGTLYVDENEQPWLVFSHEWIQVEDGEVCCIKLSEDLHHAISKPIVLFTASQAPWSVPSTGCVKSEKSTNYVTDGPFLYRCKSGNLIMLWSSYSTQGYAIGIAQSETDLITGPWLQSDKAFFEKDGGHGMLFKTFDGQLMLAIHTPNETPQERPIFIPVIEGANTIYECIQKIIDKLECI